MVVLWVGSDSALTHHRDRQVRPQAEKGDADGEEVSRQGYVGGGSQENTPVGFCGGVATLNPASQLVSGATYTVTITTGARDAAGNALPANETWSFKVR